MEANKLTRRDFLRAAGVLAAAGFGAVAANNPKVKKSIESLFATQNSSDKNDDHTSTSSKPKDVSPIKEYGKTVKEDMEEYSKETGFSGSEDLSGQGYNTCTFDVDCLAGQETCKAGTSPNTPQQPGYCVPKKK